MANKHNINIGDHVKIDGEGTGVVKEIIPRGFATCYDVTIDGTDFEIEFPGDRLSKISQIPSQSTLMQTTSPSPSTSTDNIAQGGRFIQVQENDIGNFILDQTNRNTLSKTVADLKILQAFFDTPEINESRKIQDIPPEELSPLLSKFFLAVRKQDGTEYEPNSLRCMMSSFDRQLKRFNCSHLIISSPLFARVRDVLKSKQKQLKREGKGNLTNRSDAISDAEIDMLWKNGQFGIHNPDSVLKTLWFFNTVHFGLRGSAEHRDMCWGDITLKEETDGHEYLEFSERQTKTRTGENPRNTRVVQPKLWANLENKDRCPVNVYKFYAEKRPAQYCNPTDPFYIASSTKNSPSVHESWFKRQPVGINKLNSMMQISIKGAGIKTDKHLSNHSARKYLVQKLNDSNIPPNQIMQISGHRNISSINNYSHINSNQHREISKLLHAQSTETTRPTPPVTIQNFAISQQSSSTSQQSSSILRIQGGFHSIFSGPITGGNIQIHIHQEKSPTVPKKRARLIIESDSDSP